MYIIFTLTSWVQREIQTAAFQTLESDSPHAGAATQVCAEHMWHCVGYLVVDAAAAGLNASRLAMDDGDANDNGVLNKSPPASTMRTSVRTSLRSLCCTCKPEQCRSNGNTNVCRPIQACTSESNKRSWGTKTPQHTDMIWYGMVWYGMVWYDMIWYGMVWYGMVWYGMVWYGMVWYDMIRQRTSGANLSNSIRFRETVPPWHTKDKHVNNAAEHNSTQ